MRGKAVLVLAILLVLPMATFTPVHAAAPEADPTNWTQLGVFPIEFSVYPRSTLFLNNCYYIFYRGYNASGSSLGQDYTASTDTVNWGLGGFVPYAAKFSLPTASAGTESANAATTFGNNIYVVSVDYGHSPFSFAYRYGTVGASCKIAWAIAQGDKATTGTYGQSAIATMVDSSGNWWVAIPTQTGGVFSFEVWVSANNGGSWTQKSVVTDSMKLDPALAQLQNGHVALAGRTIGANIGVKISSDGGSTWGTEVDSANTYYSSSIVPVGNTVYFAGINAASKHVAVLTYVDGQASWGGETVVDSGRLGNNDASSIGLLAGGGLYVVWDALNSPGPGGSTITGTLNYANWQPATSISGGGVGSMYAASVSNGGVAYADWVSGSSGNLLFSYDTFQIVTVTTVAPCNFLQLQCWWYPSLFMLGFAGFFLMVAGISKAPPKTAMHLFLSGLTYGSFIAVIFGIMNITLPLVLIVINALYVLRMRR